MTNEQIVEALETFVDEADVNVEGDGRVVFATKLRPGEGETYGDVAGDEMWQIKWELDHLGLESPDIAHEGKWVCGSVREKSPPPFPPDLFAPVTTPAYSGYIV
ncbi:hypothetical protein [Fimbriiglobus ruber]|uniref:Uncharacterized protein n=1 Tax=Fimbriiglobus ruber TaxID=1908690 RepID=A0A225CYB5_9BACT|nr:hypothetical protein [Fimbriiglobus ruber]OWK34331.1 hypothetical protein FRUB_10302 [Fimbriiglobus ruber]